MPHSSRFVRPGRPGPRPAARRPAFRPALECLEDRLAPARFAVIGDYGLAGAAEQHVADEVHSLNADFVLTVGNNNYPTGQASAIDANVGQYYHDYLYPYTGSYGAGSPTNTNRFFPTLGGHDWGDAYPNPSGDQPYLDYFTLPGNERYYTFTSGPVQFFALDSDANEPDGNSSTSVQAQWLQSQLAASTATWKIVYFNTAPYSTNLATPGMRWPFQAWGASAVLAGHDTAYERLVEDNNFPYFVDGLGGNGHDSGFGTPVPGSQVRYCGDFGTMLVDAQGDHITFQLVGAWDHAGQVIDSYTLYTQPEAHVPDAPSSLTAAAVSASQVNLAWTDNSSNEDAFNVYASTDGTNFTQVGTASPNALSYSVTGLSPSTTYTFRVSAANAAGTSAPTNTASATTAPAGAPANPSNLAAAAASATQVNLTWTNNATNQTGFNVYESTDGTHFTAIAAVGANATAYSWTGAAANTSYSFYVTATNAAGESTPSNTATATTPSPGSPASPSGLTATAVSGTRVNLSWVDNSTNEDGYKVYRLTDSGWSWFAVAGAGATSYSWTGASPGVSYTFQVTAYNAAGESAPSNTATATTPAPPTAPSNLTATAVNSSQVNLSWTNNATNQTGLKLYNSTDGVNWSWFAAPAAGATAYTWWGGSPGTTYSFYITATNAAGESAPSNTATATTVPAAAPPAPSRLAAAVVSATQVNLSWADNSSTETGFNVYESADGTNFTLLGTTGANVTAYTWAGATGATSYWFYVTATNAGGESAASNTATASTSPAGAPLVPSNLAAAAVNGTQVNLTWTDNATNETGFKVYESTDGVNFTVLATVGANVTSYIWTGPAPATSYWFRVTAANAAGESAPSNTATVGMGVPTPAHVVIVVEENHGYSDIIGSSQAPYLNALAQQGALMTNSSGITHPSQPNYLYLFSGSSQGVTDDNWPIGPFSSPNLASALIAAGRTFGAYSEDLPSVGYTGGDTANYDANHDPWVSFNNVPASANMPFTGYFPSDFSTLPTVSFVIPNLNNDMHNGTVSQGDSWLQNNLDAYAQWAKTNNSLLIVTWDEDDGSTTNQIPTIMVGQNVKPGQYGEQINHLSVLRTIEDMYGLPYAGQSAGATPIADIWTSTTSPPAAPGSLAAAAAANGRQVNLTWADNANNETGFNVYESTDGTHFSVIATVGANATSYSWTAAAPGTSYSFYVTASNAVGESAASNTITVTTPMAPAAPSGLTATAAANGTQVNLSWADNSSNETGFNIYRSSDGVNFASLATAGANATSYSWTGASPGTTYWFRVTAANAVGESAASNTATATTPTPPAAPTSLTATAAANGTQVNLAWADNSTNETGFKVYRSTDGVNFALLATVGANVIAYSWTGASPGTAYWFRVTASNGVGESAASNTATATTPTPPVAPSGLTATPVSSTQINLTWADNSSNETGFKIYRSTDGVHFTLLATVGANLTSYSWMGASAGATNYFYVTAYNAVGESAPSNTAMTAPPAAPSNLTARAVSSSQVNLTWADNASTETGFMIEVSLDGVNFIQIATVSANATSYSATGLLPLTKYYFRVRAYNAVGNSAYSNTASATTPLV